MKKNVLFVVMVVCLIFSIFGQSVGDFEYTENNGKITIIKYNGNIKDVVIPEKINGLPVVAIGDTAFQYFSFYVYQHNNIPLPYLNPSPNPNLTQITSITLPNTITTIGSCAFLGNQLTSIILPNSITTIESHAFYDNQLTSLTLPNSITIIGEGAFENNKLTKIKFPKSITTIGCYAFRNNKLTRVVIPKSVVNLDNNAFDENVKIKRR